MKRVFFHIHIWKTAGTTFLNICRQNFGKGFHRDIMLVQNWFLSVGQLEWILDYHDWVRCYSCHMLSGDLPYNSKDTEVIGIAFVRNPIDRFISSYNFQKVSTYRGGAAKGTNFDDFIRDALEKTDNPMWRNGQTNVLGGSRTKSGISKIADRIRDGRLILLPTKRFDESCVVLEHLFPDEYADCSYVRQNVSRRKEVITQQQRDAIGQYMDLDINLVALADQYLDDTLNRLLPDLVERKNIIDSFRDRCHKKKQKSRFAHIARLPLNLINKAFPG